MTKTLSLGLLDTEEVEGQGATNVSIRTSGKGKRSYDRRIKGESTFDNRVHRPKKKKPAKIIVGVDFGTTFTGVSYVSSTGTPDSITVLNNWPGSGGHFDKVPSLISYNATTGDHGDQYQLSSWGYTVRPQQEAYTWFKLGIAQNERSGEHDDPFLKRAIGAKLVETPPGKHFSDLCSDYLKEVYDYFVERMRTCTGPETFNGTCFKFVLTTPAGWSDIVRNNIKSAAAKAGFGSRDGDSISMVSEPEAAALAAFDSYVRKWKSEGPFKENTNSIVVDMGGGTVDLITYRISKIHPLEVEEACVGMGAKCGATIIDRQFHKFMEDRFGEAFKRKGAKEIGPGSRFMNDFETVKRSFDGRVTGPFFVCLKMNWTDEDVYDSDTGEVIITRDELKTMFEPLIERTIGLIQQQVEATRNENSFPIKTLVLCGGLAESKYIVKRLEEYCKENLQDAKTIVPDNPWSAISRGATIRGLKPRSTIKARKCRRSYGVIVHKAFEEGIHREEDAFNHPNFGKRAGNQMSWHIKKNDRVPINGRKWLKASTQLGGNNGELGHYDIYCSDLDPPPNRKGPGAAKLGELKVDFSKVPHPKKRKLGRYSRVPQTAEREQNVKIGQIIHPERNTVEFEARVGRRRVGTNEFEYKGVQNGESDDEDLFVRGDNGNGFDLMDIGDGDGMNGDDDEGQGDEEVSDNEDEDEDGEDDASEGSEE